MDIKEIDYNKYKEDLGKAEINFTKKLLELENMIKEEVGEDNKHFYRIELITELIGKDVNELVKGFSEVLETIEMLNTVLEKIDKMNEVVKKETGLSVND
jgi:hypothetical protein